MNLAKVTYGDYFSEMCCCYHDHEENCWFKKEILEDENKTNREKFHNKFHNKCGNVNNHNDDCQVYKDFIEEESENREIDFDEDEDEDKKIKELKHICCCKS